MKKTMIFFYLTIYYAVHTLHQEGTHSLYNFVTDNFKEYDLDTEYCLNIDKYLVCEGRDMISVGSGPYIILLKLKTILFTWS
jgi:hypothetical protein